MRILSKILAAAAVFILSLQVGLADVPSGAVSLSFDAGTAPIWDLSGSFPIDQTLSGIGGSDVPFSFGVDLANDARGRLTGTGTTLLVIGNDLVAAAYTAKGRVSGGGGRATRVTLSVKITGQDIVAGVDTAFTVTIVYNLTLTGDTLSGSSRGKARFAKLGTGKIKSNVSIPLPAGVDGAWTVNMNILPLKKLTGTATIVFTSGRTLSGNLTGSFSPNSNLAKVRITGVNDARGTSISLNFNNSEGVPTAVSVRGKLLGQTLRD